MHKHCDSHRSDSSGDGGDIRSLRLYRREINVARQLSVRAAIHSYVNNYRALLDHIRGEEISLSYRRNENVGAAAYVRGNAAVLAQREILPRDFSSCYGIR